MKSHTSTGSTITYEKHNPKQKCWLFRFINMFWILEIDIVSQKFDLGSVSHLFFGYFWINFGPFSMSQILLPPCIWGVCMPVMLHNRFSGTVFGSLLDQFGSLWIILDLYETVLVQGVYFIIVLWADYLKRSMHSDSDWIWFGLPEKWVITIVFLSPVIF